MDSITELKLKRLHYLRRLQKELQELEGWETKTRRPWREEARQDQLPPEGDWYVWLILAGRGWGKTRSCAEWCAEKARRYPGCRIALVANTYADARDTMVEGDSGLLACFGRDELRNRSEDGSWNRSNGELFLANGSRFKTYTSEKPWKLRGPQFHFAWGDEAAFWADAGKGCITDTTWTNLAIATRLKKRPDWDDEFRSQIVVATTPRPVALLKVTDPDPSRAGLMQRPTTIITTGRTMDNIANLSEQYKANVIAPLLGTRLGRQELDAELLEDRQDALWRREWIEETRIGPNNVPDLVRIVVAVDPAVTDGESAAETGIVVAGASRDGHGYVLGDHTLRGTPKETMDVVAHVYDLYQADRVVAEVNNGGDYIGNLLHTVSPNIPFRAVRASRGKALRAEPVSALYEQRRIHHAGTYPFLEDQMCQWSPLDTESPDRLDALVWAFADLHDLVHASWKDAFGIVTCGSCNRPFVGDDHGVKRTVCPFCNAAVPEIVAA